MNSKKKNTSRGYWSQLYYEFRTSEHPWEALWFEFRYGDRIKDAIVTTIAVALILACGILIAILRLKEDIL